MSPARILKGALAYSGAQTGAPGPVVFQFNPQTLTRLQDYSAQTNSVSEAIRFELVLNAVEGMEQEDAVMGEDGIYSQIAALEEILAYQSKLRPNNWLARLFGTSNSRILQFTYGERVIPVRLRRLHIKEILHNSELKPLHAKVAISLRVLTEQDLRGNQGGLQILARYQQYRKLKADQTRSEDNRF